MTNRYTQRFNIKTKRFEVLDRQTEQGFGDYNNITAATNAAWALNVQSTREVESK